MLNKNLRGYVDYKFSSGSSIGSDYTSFQTKMRNDLKKQAEENDMELYKFNKGHYYFSAVLKDKTYGNYIYISIDDVRFRVCGGWENKTLVRTMEHEKDWAGGDNNYSEWENVGKKAKELAIKYAENKNIKPINENDNLIKEAA